MLPEKVRVYFRWVLNNHSTLNKWRKASKETSDPSWMWRFPRRGSMYIEKNSCFCLFCRALLLKAADSCYLCFTSSQHSAFQALSDVLSCHRPSLSKCRVDSSKTQRNALIAAHVLKRRGFVETNGNPECCFTTQHLFPVWGETLTYLLVCPR